MSQNQKRILQGIVVSTKMEKSAVVKIETLKMHPKYHKRVKHSKKYAIHDEKKICAAGDLVEIIECRPISKTKKFALHRVLKKAAVVEVVV